MDAQVSESCCPLPVRSDQAFLNSFQAEAETSSSCPQVVLSEDSDEGKSLVNMLTTTPRPWTDVNMTNRD